MRAILISESDLEEMAGEVLTEDGMVTIGSLAYPAGRVLRTVDPIAWRCHRADYYDSLYQDGYRLEDENEYFVCPECGDAWTETEEAAECCGKGE